MVNSAPAGNASQNGQPSLSWASPVAYAPMPNSAALANANCPA